MTAGDLVVRLSVWLALVGYAAGALYACHGSCGDRCARRARNLWTLGCLAFAVHVLSAFQVNYAWSHAIALEQTARQTAELTGRNTGVGLYLNYLFTVLWIGDAVWWWRGLPSYRERPGALVATLHGFWFFMMFNGTVVFATGPSRWIGVAISLALAATLARHRPWRGDPR